MYKVERQAFYFCLYFPSIPTDHLLSTLTSAVLEVTRGGAEERASLYMDNLFRISLHPLKSGNTWEPVGKDLRITIKPE